METRHPLTIPAAIVLGTAVVATAVPLPTSTPPTATATGTAHVTRAYTDKSTHEPGTQATILAEASTEGTVHFSVSHLGVEVASGDATVTNGKATWTYTTPSENNQGYLVTATGGDGTHAETAIDASTSWTCFPRMGFPSHFKPTALEGTDGHTTYEAFLFQKPQDYIDKLSQDYHINALQYYDWQYRHEQPVATGDLEKEWPLWYRDTYASKKTITDYIIDAKNANMGSLAYSMAYAANDNYDTNTIKDDWRLREDNGSYWVHDLAGGSAVTFTIDAGQGGTFTFTTRYARQNDDPAYHQMILDMGKTGQQKLIKYVHFDATGSDYTWKDMTETVELTPGTHTISYWVPTDKNYARQHRLHYVPRVQRGFRQARGRGVRGERRAPPGARRLRSHARQRVLRELRPFHVRGPEGVAEELLQHFHRLREPALRRQPDAQGTPGRGLDERRKPPDLNGRSLEHDLGEHNDVQRGHGPAPDQPAHQRQRGQRRVLA